MPMPNPRPGQRAPLLPTSPPTPSRRRRPLTPPSWSFRRQLQGREVLVQVDDTSIRGVIADLGPDWLALEDARHIGHAYEGDQVVESPPVAAVLDVETIRFMQVLGAPPRRWFAAVIVGIRR